MEIAQYDGNGLCEWHSVRQSRQSQGACNGWDCHQLRPRGCLLAGFGISRAARLADLERFAGRNEQAKAYDRDADRIRKAYVPTLLNPKTGILAGWRSRDGELHDYWFTVRPTARRLPAGLVPTIWPTGSWTASWRRCASRGLHAVRPRAALAVGSGAEE